MKNSINFERLEVMLDNFRSSNGKSTWFVYESENRITALNRYLEELKSPVSYGAFIHRVKRNVFQYKGYNILTPKEIQDVIRKDVSPTTHVELNNFIRSDSNDVEIEEVITIKRVAKISIDAIRQKFNLSDDIEIKIV